jgi:hypothetical protein
VEPLCAGVLAASGAADPGEQLPPGGAFELRMIQRHLLQLEQALPPGAIAVDEFNRWGRGRCCMGLGPAAWALGPGAGA